jgi:predicted metal-dependent HD superfamily phosphohydrolase
MPVRILICDLMIKDFSPFRVTEEQLSFLSTEWHLLSSHHGAVEEAKERLRTFLFRQYSADARVYHNLSHIAEMLRLINSYREQVQDYESVCFAVWFHDAVYDTRRSDNEDQSAEFAERTLPELLAPPEVINRTTKLILATKKREAGKLDSDVGVFLDADLSILGAHEQVYLKYSEAIRREYQWVPLSLYRKKRRQILESFLTRERIYFTQEMHTRLEAQAKRNLAREILALGS